MISNKNILIGVGLIIIGISILFIFISYYSASHSPGIQLSKTDIANGNKVAIKELLPEYKELLPQLIPITHSNQARKVAYQLTETEKLFYMTAIKHIQPKDTQNLNLGQATYERSLRVKHEDTFWISEDFIKKNPILIEKNPDSPQAKDYQEIKRKRQEISDKQKEMLLNLDELIEQYKDSSYYQYYLETAGLVRRLIQEDEDVNKKYGIMSGGIKKTRIVDKNNTEREISPEEKADYFIYYLRNSYFYKTDCYKINFEVAAWASIPQEEPFFVPAREIVLIGNPAIPKLIGLLEDRRPIIAVDEDNIPSRFYRYQDAAVEILQTMFTPVGNKINSKLPLAQRPFPVELSEGEYFSSYLEQQTPQEQQNTINYIKKWVEEAMANPPKQEQPPEEPK